VRRERELARTGRIYEVVHTPVRSPDGTLSKLAVFRDITERKEAEEKLRETNRELDAFVYTVSHDLRAPLTPIIGYAEYLLENSSRFDPEEREILTEIERQGQRMYGLMEDLLALSRVGQVDAPEEPVDAEGVVRDVLQQLSAEINAADVQVRIGSLPPVLVPETLLLNLFSNLIGNALRYAGGHCRIEVDGRHAGANVVYFVRDFGPGISAKEAQRIFDPFYRGGTSAGTTGTGIGLATVRKIARLYGGRAWVERTPGGGATFCVEFGEEFTAADRAG
jgi:signal transduction histidine kinase